MSEGDPTQFFCLTPAVVQEEVATNEEGSEEDGVAIPDHIFHMGGNGEDIAHIRGLSFSVDDNNEPVPENTLDPNDEPNEAAEKETLGWNGMDERESGNFFNIQPKFLHGLVALPTYPYNRIILNFFLTLFLQKYLQEIVLAKKMYHTASYYDLSEFGYSKPPLLVS